MAMPITKCSAQRTKEVRALEVRELEESEYRADAALLRTILGFFELSHLEESEYRAKQSSVRTILGFFELSHLECTDFFRALRGTLRDRHRHSIRCAAPGDSDRRRPPRFPSARSGPNGADSTALPRGSAPRDPVRRAAEAGTSCIHAAHTQIGNCCLVPQW